MIPSWQSVKNSFSQMVTARHAAYFDGVDLHALSGDSPGRQKKKLPSIVIVSRKCYRERDESFPIKSSQELRKLLDQRQQPGELVMHFIGAWRDGKRQVQSVVFNDKVAILGDHARVIIPESFMLNYLAPQGLSQIETPAARLFFARSEQQSQAALSGGVIRNKESACIAFGYSPDKPVNHWDWATYQSNLRYALACIPGRYFSEFMQKQRSQDSQAPWREMTIGALILLVVYAGVSTGYLHWMEASRSERLAAYGSAVNERLSERSVREQEMERMSALGQRNADKNTLLSSYDVIAGLYLNDITLTQISGDFKFIDLRGEARSATALVTELSSMPQVRSVEFTAPVRRGRSGEVFSLRIELEQDWRLPQGGQDGA